MTHTNSITAFVIKPVPNGAGVSEFRQSMQPHPLVYQELPHDPIFGIYNRRLRSLEYGNVDWQEIYWRLRRSVVLAHTGELATEIRGPGAEAMLNRVFTRDVSRIKVGRCSYQIACLADGGTLMDGILLRLETDRFWYAQGDGEFLVWLQAQAEGFDVQVSNPDIWISQIQGPRSMDVLAEVADDGMPEPFRYFDMVRVQIAGQSVVISRTGFTSELGWEFYFGPDADAGAIGEKIMAVGERYGIHTIPAAATNARRIEAGLLFSGTDFDTNTTPYTAGLGAFVDLGKGDFIGKTALAKAAQNRRTWGLRCVGGIAHHGDSLILNGKPAGRVCSSAWSPYLQYGIAIVRLGEPGHGPGTKLQVECTDGVTRNGEVCELPMYDREGAIVRGKDTVIPEIQ